MNRVDAPATAFSERTASHLVAIDGNWSDATGVDDGLGRSLGRLADVKAAYDPDNLFRRNDNVAPA